MTKSRGGGGGGGVPDLSKISECTKSGVPTTFVETDIHGFRDLVQKLTGVFDGQKGNFKADMNSATFIKHGAQMGPRKTAFKLQDRRRVQRKLEINPTLASTPSPRPSPSPSSYVCQGNVFSPTFSSPNFHSPVTPLGPDPFASRNHSPSSSFSVSVSMDLEGEGEFSFGDWPKREPELLPLFPLHSTST